MDKETSQGKILVVIQLSGGNDGLNTIVPYRNDIYYQQRPGISIQPQRILKLNDRLGLNPHLSFLKDLYDQGQLSIINNVGYPNPIHSHFRAMDIWHTGSDSGQALQTGWLGRYLDEVCKDCGNDYTAISLTRRNLMALEGLRSQGFSMGNIRRLREVVSVQRLKELDVPSSSQNESVKFLYRTISNTLSSTDIIYQYANRFQSKRRYEGGAIGRDLKQVAELIISGIDTSVYYVEHGGFDTHSSQKKRQNQLLENYNLAISSFIQDLKAHNRFNDVLIFTFSEFGRRVAENGISGTDHGTANNVWLMGGRINNPGIHNAGPDLQQLENGDLVYSVDFREVYATILEKWLHVNPAMVLGKRYPLLNIFT